MSFKKYFENFCELTRFYALPMTIASLFTVWSYAHYSMNYTCLNFLITLIAICSLHLGANLFDDYIDVKSELKKGIELKDINFNSRVPKARLILNNTYSFKQIEIILIILFLIPVSAGIYFTFVSGLQILIYMILGGLLTLFYPISAKYYLSETIIGLIYGPLMITGGYFALTKEFNFNLFILSTAIMLSTVVLLHTHSIMDWEYDIKNSKKSLAILTGSKENAVKVLKALITCAYAIVVLGVLSAKFNPHMLYVFLTLPIATKLPASIKDYINIKDVKFQPRWYYGLFENWDAIKKQGIEYFMYRFYLARNFALFFAIFAGIGAVI